ncbi:Rrf2 family transcriptional regulator [Candidatus Eisenbacteria bacterium]|uniref:Rrf2 family transcriptional regulator n=1 Tax=Eiseniibacteriota bacterium TaxID=2212470 RepID=A0ABV6YIV2_UNCEI
MRVSTRTCYGLRALAEIAGGYPDRPIPLPEVASRQRVSLKYLEQVMAIHKAAKFARERGGMAGSGRPDCSLHSRMPR